ncbi:transmembrane protein [Mycobacterium tuberculosis]|nr:transmembrane protein [Mycobacterium tuberculosis]
MMSHEHDAGDLDALRAEIEAAERRVAREIEPGARALVVAILVFVLLGSFILPHTGSVRGWDVLFSSHGAGRAAVALPSRVFAWLALVFGVGFSMLALLTRRWALAWVALAGPGCWPYGRVRRSPPVIPAPVSGSSSPGSPRSC